MSERYMIRRIMIVWYCISINSGLVELVELLTVVPYYTATYYASILVGVVQLWTIARTIVWYPFWMACLRWCLTSALARLTTTTVALPRTPECRFMASKCQVVFSYFTFLSGRTGVHAFPQINFQSGNNEFGTISRIVGHPLSQFKHSKFWT